MIIDCHADTISRITARSENLKNNEAHFDLERAIKAGVGLQVMALFTRERDSARALLEILRQIDYFKNELAVCSDQARLITSNKDLNEELGAGKIGLILHLEGGEALGNNLAVLHALHELGVRSIGLTWNNRNQLADGVMDCDSGGGLSKIGKMVVGEMERLGMLVDLAHISVTGFYNALEITSKPVIVSHANVISLCSFPRNLNDQQMKAIAETGGILGISFVPDFVRPSDPTIDDLIDHIAYACDIMGEDHVAFGSDFDGTDYTVVKSVEDYPVLIEAMGKRGFNPKTIEKIESQNFLRVLAKTLG